MSPLVLTVYTDDLDNRIQGYHDMVVATLADKKFPYVSRKCAFWSQNKEFVGHGDILNIYINQFFSYTNHDIILLMDVDCIPLNDEIMDLSFELASQGNLVGNYQVFGLRENALPYIAPSFMCFSKDTYYECSRPSFKLDKTYDTGEFFSLAARKLNIPLVFYNIKHNDFTIDVKVKDREETVPAQCGVTYEYEGVESTYHLFFARENLETSKVFYDKCQQVILENCGKLDYKKSNITL